MAIAPKRPQLGEVLVERGLVSLQELEAALGEQKRTEEFLGRVLTRMGVVSEEALLPVLAEQLGIPYVQLKTCPVDPHALEKVSAKFAHHYSLLPLRLANRVLEVAIADPYDVHTLDELRLLLDCEIKPVLAGEREIQEAIQRHYGLGAQAVEQLLSADRPTATAATSATEDLGIDADSIIAFVNQMILQAVKDRATDIHIEPYDQYMRIRERVDGLLYEMPIPPNLVKVHELVISRIKIMAKLDIIERRLPHDGRIKVRVNHEDLDLRISIIPTSFGESADIRILSSHMLFNLEELGLAADNLATLSTLIARPYGIIFVTGPTGSGKTTTLYACLSKLNAPHQKIITIEDPVEYRLAGMSQIQVHPKIGLTFAHGLRSVLRHDPDIMMVGEVRDPETAEITIRSALTGHLVFSTLHTNDAAGGVARLLDMDIEPYLVVSSVLGFIAQRLVRVVCAACREPRPADPHLREQFGVQEVPPTLLWGRGCPTCKGTGYHGRTAIYEFLLLHDAVRQLILRRASAQDILRAAQQAGMRTMRQDGWLKILHGVTTPEEVLRVT